jgi:glycerol-3-phosphate dehydrogenase
MKRDTTLLRDHRFDAVVIGGGIHGATAFRQLAAAGMKTALIEKDDFGGGTSANSLKILHSGLRYLQHLNFKRIRESIRSRKHFMEMAPHLIRPMPCIMPTYGLGIEGKPVMAVALALFDLIGCDRNEGAPPENRVGRGRTLSRRECLRIGPGIRPEGLTGAALWYDDMILNTERMTLAFIKDAMRRDAVCANYLEAGRIVIADREVTGVEVTDRLTCTSFTIRTPLVINAAGPWMGELQRRSVQLPTTEDLAKAVNIVVDRALFPGYGVGLAGSGEYVDRDAAIKRGKRLFFFAPWQGRTIIGTTYTYSSGQDSDLTVTGDDINQLLREVNTIYPMARLTPDNVIFSHAGLVPAHRPTGERTTANPQMVKHSQVIDHQVQDGINGLFTLEGVKYTTAPAIARELEQLLGIRAGRRTAATPAPACRRSHTFAERRLIESLGPRFPHIEQVYGPDCADVFAIIAEDEMTAVYLRIDPPLLKAEVIHAVREEMALTLCDVILRRTDSGTTGCPSRHDLQAIARVMAGELGWDEARISSEIEQVAAYFNRVLGIGGGEPSDQ